MAALIVASQFIPALAVKMSWIAPLKSLQWRSAVGSGIWTPLLMVIVVSELCVYPMALIPATSISGTFKSSVSQ